MYIQSYSVKILLYLTKILDKFTRGFSHNDHNCLEKRYEFDEIQSCITSTITDSSNVRILSKHCLPMSEIALLAFQRKWLSESKKLTTDLKSLFYL